VYSGDQHAAGKVLDKSLRWCLKGRGVVRSLAVFFVMFLPALYSSSNRCRCWAGQSCLVCGDVRCTLYRDGKPKRGQHVHGYTIIGFSVQRRRRAMEDKIQLLLSVIICMYEHFST
jgi:hypothetical protein